MTGGGASYPKIPFRRARPPARRTGSGRYVFETSSSRSFANHFSRPVASIAAKVISSVPGAPAFARASA